MTAIVRHEHLDSRATSVLLACCLFWGFQQVLVKATLPELPPVFQAGVRFVGATIVLWGWCRWRGVARFARDGSLGWGMLAGTLFAGIEMIIPGASAISVFGDDYAGFLIAILPPGAFFALGMLIAAFNAINVRLAARARRQPPPATAHKAPEEQADTEPAAAS